MIVLDYVVSGAYRLRLLHEIARRQDSHVVARVTSTHRPLSMNALFTGQGVTQLNVKTNDAWLFPSLLDGVQALHNGNKLLVHQDLHLDDVAGSVNS